MYSYLIIHHTQTTYQVALFINSSLYGIVSHDKKSVSQTLIMAIEDLLKQSGCALKEISFIGVNQGPGLFSTLRAILATVNALSYAQGIPLIGVDGLNAFLIEHQDSQFLYSLALLQAYNNEVYYGIMKNQVMIESGYSAVPVLLKTIEEKYPTMTFRCIGNVIDEYKDNIKNSPNLYVSDTVSVTCSLDTIAYLACREYEKNQSGLSFLSPLYLKKHPAEYEKN